MHYASQWDTVKDGKLTHVMCCICFESVPVDSLWVCWHGQKWDNCIPCGEQNGCKGLLHE